MNFGRPRIPSSTRRSWTSSTTSCATTARRTLERLVAAGHTREDTRRLIGCVVSTEIYDVLTQHRPFDEAAYVAALQRLPIHPAVGGRACQFLRSPGVQHSTPKP